MLQHRNANESGCKFYWTVNLVLHNCNSSTFYIMRLGMFTKLFFTISCWNFSGIYASKDTTVSYWRSKKSKKGNVCQLITFNHFCRKNYLTPHLFSCVRTMVSERHKKFYGNLYSNKICNKIMNQQYLSVFFSVLMFTRRIEEYDALYNGVL